MKWFVIVSIICVISYGYGSKLFDATAVDPICWPELNRTRDDLLQCFNLERFNGPAIQMELYTTLFEYTGDEKAVRQFASKYCNIGNEFINCFPIYFNMTQACQPIETELARVLDRTVKRTLEFMCENEAEAFVQLVINNGFKIFMNNMELANACANKMQTSGNAVVQGDDGATLLQFCEDVREALSCHIDWMEIHGNAQLINFTNGTYLITAQELGC